MRSTPWSRRRPSMKEETFVAMPRFCPVQGAIDRSDLGLAKRLRGCNVRQVRERLREVPHQLPAAGVVLLAEQPEVVRSRHGVVEHLPRVALARLPRKALRQPERARQERALAARLPIPVGMAADEPAVVK